MSFVNEHYGNVFRVLALNTLRPDSPYQSEPSSVAEAAASDTDQGAGDNDEHKELVQRAFDLSTLVLASSGTTSRLQLSQHSADVDDGKADIGGGGRDRYGSEAQVTVAIPSLTSIIGDLQLVQAATANTRTLGLASERAAELVLMSAVAAIHAYTIGQLLDAALPLSIDMDYWNAQDDSALSLIYYFIQSLPQRLTVWGIQIANALLRNYSAQGMLDQIRATMTSRLLFPELCISASATEKVRGHYTRLPRIPESANIVSLTKREIRFKQQRLADAQESLDEMIGTLSRVVATRRGGLAGSSLVTTDVLLRQVAGIVNVEQPALGDADSVAQSAEQLALLVRGISSKFNENIKNYCRPSLLARCWIPGLVCIVGIRGLASYVVGHRKDIEGWAMDVVVTATNYLSQYILAPLRSAYETIRYGRHTYSVMTEESLRSDLRSLEDMVVGFSSSADSAQVVRQRVESGDLSDVMRVYARE
ncbi:Nuclear control of ATPase protein 2, partial [Coemansia aciculifera]